MKITVDKKVKKFYLAFSNTRKPNGSQRLAMKSKLENTVSSRFQRSIILTCQR